MFLLTESEEAAIEGDLPPLPTDRWWGDHLREVRWQLELGRLLVDPVFRGGGVPRGDGRPVILMPGLGAGDQTLLVLAAWLRRIGYRPHLCGFVANVSCSDRAVERVERRLEAVHARYDRRVALIGHSRGGHYARALGLAASRTRLARDLDRRRIAPDACDQLSRPRPPRAAFAQPCCRQAAPDRPDV